MVLDQSIPVFKYFEDLTKIPHGSKNEKAVSDYLVRFAKDHELVFARDDMHNVVIYKKGSAGREDEEPLMLQGHMDMVCAKTKESTHDFDHDPLTLHIEDGWLYADHTTLGADDGLGVSLMLAVLANDELSHPPLECVFTVQEEIGLFGAIGLDESLLSSRRMISLDGETYGETTISTAGGCEVTVTAPMTRHLNIRPAYRIEVSGLLGGHSGAEINKEQGNAHLILARIIRSLMANGKTAVCSMQGGDKSNAIPQFAEAVVASDVKDVRAVVDHVMRDVKAEYEFTDPHIRADVAECSEEYCFSLSESKALVNFMVLCPFGVQAYSPVVDKLPDASLNMGILTSDQVSVTMTWALRASMTSRLYAMVDQIYTLSGMCGYKMKMDGEYAGWAYDPHSVLRAQFEDCFERFAGVPMKEMAVHGGLETGIFKGKIPQMDIVTFGATAVDIHTPNEHLDLQSLLDTYGFLCQFLSEV